ncbi:MAG: hypothetical protein LBG83_00810 [Oscillospiraceae bacterium]|nr:hypothetical protein [Oscillospiraceae bacterium]
MTMPRDDYVPNEKYRNMFGIERNGYGMERVDLYLAQLEVAFKKIREDNRNLKQQLTELQQALPGSESAMQIAAQEQYIAQLQGQLAEQQEQNQRLLGQMSDAAYAAPQQQPQVDDLMNQIAALRAEADELRQQLRRQAAPQPGYQQPFVPFGESYADPRQDLIGKVLVEARQQAEEVKRAAKQEAEQSVGQARRQADTIRAERDRIYTQLQGISYALRSALREAGEPEFQPHIDDFGVMGN